MTPGSADGIGVLGAQVNFASDKLIGFYFRDDYKEFLRSTRFAQREQNLLVGQWRSLRATQTHHG
jgi:hypothetical protein